MKRVIMAVVYEKLVYVKCLSMIYCFSVILLSYCAQSTNAESTIELTAPVNPVEDRAILSIHCQIWDLQEGQEVSMYRLPPGDTIPKRLTLGDGVSTDDERVFLATRKPMDGSTIYFLSIMDVNVDDGGEYSCRVASYLGVIGAKTLNVEILYFPEENTNPKCSTVPTIPGEGYVLYPGQQLKINCSADRGNPTVSIEWNNTANSKIKTRDIVHVEADRTVYSELTLRSTAKRVKAVFICTLKSRHFPEKKKTCHIGPIEILPDPDLSHSSGTQIPSFDDTAETTAISVVHTPRRNSNDDSWESKSLVCRQQCTSWSQTSFYWIVATIATFVIAFVLFITCVILFVRYNRLSSSYQDPKGIQVRPHIRDDIYTELDCRRSGGDNTKLYLAIDKRENKTLQLKSVHPEFEDFHYVAPNMPNAQTMQS